MTDATSEATCSCCGEIVRGVVADEQLERALDRLRSLLLRAEQDRDEWKRKAEIDEQQAADRMDDWQVAHEHAVKMTERVAEVEERLAVCMKAKGQAAA